MLNRDEQKSADLARLTRHASSRTLVMKEEGMTAGVIPLTIQKIMSDANFKEEMLHNIRFADRLFNQSWEIAVQAALKQWSPIRIAIEEGAGAHKELEGLITANQGSIGKADIDGVTPLHRAAEKGDWFAIMRLLRAQADPNAKDKNKQTPADAALAQGQDYIFLFLRAPKRYSSFERTFLTIKDKEEIMDAIFKRLLSGKCTDEEVKRYGTSQNPDYKKALKEKLFEYVRDLPFSEAIEKCEEITINSPKSVQSVSQLARVFWGQRGVSEPSLQSGTLLEIVNEIKILRERERQNKDPFNIEMKAVSARP